jgi:hypothetical protein
MLRRLLAALLASVVLLAVSLSASGTAAYAALTYYYAGAGQNVSDSIVSANFAVAAPTLTAGDFHTQVAMVVKGGAAGNDMVAIGWTVDPALNGDSDPHLFVYWWKNNVAQCYNTACPGYTAYPGATYTAGQRLLAGTPQKFRIQYSGGAWWFWVGTTAGVGSYIGYISDSNWTAAWSTFSTVQVYGEVAANVAAPTTEMGNGFCSENALALTIGSVTYTTSATVNLAAFATDSSKYSSTLLSARTLRYGGDGSCP